MALRLLTAIVQVRLQPLRIMSCSRLALAAFAFCSLTPAWAAPTHTVFAGAQGTQVHVDAPAAGILHVWVARHGADGREASLATQDAPKDRVPLQREDRSGHVMVDTGRLRLDFEPATLGFSLREPKGGGTLIEKAAFQVAPGKPAWSLTATLAANEQVMGLGEDNHNNGRLDRRGTVRDLWAGQQIESGNVTAQYPIPFQVDLLPDGRAFGVFYDNVHHLTYDLGHAKPNELRLDAAGGEIDVYFIAGPKIADVIERYTRLTGRPSLPPLWTLGYWQSRCTYYDWSQLDAAYEQLHARGFPVDVMVIDADWPEVITDYQWAPRWLASGRTPAEKIADYARRGVKIVMSQSGPMVRQDSPTYPSGWARGVFATDGHGNPVECGYYGGKLLDFTAPRMNEWLWPQLHARDADGIAGWWLDLTEPEGEPPQTVYHAGPAADIHNEYSLRCTLSFEGVQLKDRPDQRPWILTRTGSAGLQRHHASVWTGDIYSDYATLRAHPPEMLNSGLSGFAWWTCDTGGFLTGYYRNDLMGAHARLYERWMEFSAFSPITRAHKAGGVPEPYQFGPAVEQSTRHYLRQRYRLMPYLYSCAWQASQTGLPIVRPLALEFQDDPDSRTTPGDEYMFGAELLVAPVLAEGVGNRAVYFPPGRWVDWDTGVEYEGGRKWVVAAPQNRIPVAVRPGAIIPLAPDMQSTGEKPWDPLTLEVFPAGRSEFTLYRDDGISFAYRQGDSTLTTFRCAEADERIGLTIEESNKRYVPKTYRLRLHLDRRPAKVRVGAVTLPFDWDENTRVLECTVTNDAGLRHDVDIAVEAQRLPARPAPKLKLDMPNPDAVASAGLPAPHFFPAPKLPARIKAVNYDNGGEGVAFHTTRPLPEKGAYRSDDFGVVPTNDAGGEYVLRGLEAGDWLRYSVDPGNGGYFDLSVRVASRRGGARIRFVEFDRDVAEVDVPATGDSDRFLDVTVPSVYLNPGERALMVYVDQPGFTFHSFQLRPTRSPSTDYPAAWGLRAGTCEVTSAGAGATAHRVLDKLGREGSSVMLGVFAARPGAGKLEVRYANHSGNPVSVSVQVGNGAELGLKLPPTKGDAWASEGVPVTYDAGANRVVIRGHEPEWNSVSLDTVGVR
jgi:alpha-glucosidase